MSSIKFNDFLIARVGQDIRNELRKLAEKLMTSESVLLRQGVLYVLHKNGVNVEGRKTWLD